MARQWNDLTDAEVTVLLDALEEYVYTTDHFPDEYTEDEVRAGEAMYYSVYGEARKRRIIP